MGKETAVSSEGELKETTADRLKKLIGNRSVRAAAKDWGLPYSTVSNYLTRQIEPSLDAAIRIAQAEQVDLIWLAKGSGEARTEIPTNEPLSSLEQAWRLIYESMGPEVISEFVKLIHRKGIEGILSLEKGTNNASKAGSDLSPQVKQLFDLITSCNDEEVREILQRAERIKSAATPGSKEVNQVTKKVS